MKRLWVAAALAPLSFAATAGAQVTISNSTSTPVATATANGGQPADIIVGAGGEVNPKTAGTSIAQAAAVTLNSNNNVSNNGTIQTSNIDYSTGIAAQGGFAGSITNGGSITISETNSQKVNGTNGIAQGIYNNGTLLGNFAAGTSRFGVQITGDSPLTGTLTNTGSISIVGENSAGIFIDKGGLNDTSGAGLVDTGTITLTGDSGYGIHSLGQIVGAVSIGGAITVTGENSVGVALDQGATGRVDVASSITTTGFHSLTAPTSTNLVKSLLPSQLLPGGPALTIGGSVGGGISVDAAIAAVAATSTTAAVTATTGGTVTAYGAPAIIIGGAGPSTIGVLSTGGPSLLIGGGVVSSGLYQNFGATGVQIGTTGGGAVTMPGGIDVTGSISATTIGTSLTATDGAGNAISPNAIGLHLLSGADVGGITVGAPNTIGGSITATSTSTVANSVTAIRIESGAVGGVTLNNYGTILAEITGIGAVVNGPPAAGGVVGTVTAISDQAGAISVINNTGSITASLVPIVSNATAKGTTTALDLSANTTGVAITQTQAAIIPATSSTSATTPAAPSITGDVLFGSGAANLNIMAGTLTGAISFGSSAGNSLDIENGSVVTGGVTEAPGGQLALSVGTNGVNTATSTLNNTSLTHIGLSSLNIGQSGQVIFTVDPANGQGAQFAVTGSANLAAGAKIGLNLISADPSVQTFTLISTTGTLTSAATNQSLLGQTPFLFNASLSQTTGPEGSVSVTVSPRTPAQLGLNPAETAAYTAIFDQLKADQDLVVTADVLSKTNRSDFIHLYDQFLPDYAGGPFDSLVVGQGQIAQAEADAPIKLQTDGTRGWVQEIGYENNREDSSQANGYRSTGFGIIGGIEQARGDSAVGLAASFLTDGVKDDRQGPDGLISTSGVEVGAYWRDGSGADGLNMHASINGGYMFIASHRLLFDENNAGTVELYREAKGQWNGLTASAEFGSSYQIPVGRFYIRPEVIADYVYLYESAFTEHGGGPSEDLGVAARNSSEASVQGDLVIGADLGGVYHWRPEMTFGWREVVSGGPGDTTAHFLSGGPSFTLSPKFDDKGSLIARLGVRAGGTFADFSADAGGQYNSTYQVYDARAVARFLF